MVGAVVGAVLLWAALIALACRIGAATDTRPVQRALSAGLAGIIGAVGVALYLLGTSALSAGWRWTAVGCLLVAPVLMCTAAWCAYDALRR